MDELELKQNISRMSDEDLIEMVTSKAHEYRKDALYLATKELEARRIDYNADGAADDGSDPDEIDEASEEPAEESTGADSAVLGARRARVDICPMCRAPLRTGTLVAEKEVTIIFGDNREERFVKVSACSKCGQVFMLVDYETTVE